MRIYNFILNPHQSSQYPAPVRQKQAVSTHTLHRHRPTTVVTLKLKALELSPPPLFTRAHSTSSPDHQQPTARHISLSPPGRGL